MCVSKKLEVKFLNYGLFHVRLKVVQSIMVSIVSTSRQSILFCAMIASTRKGTMTSRLLRLDDKQLLNLEFNLIAMSIFRISRDYSFFWDKLKGLFESSDPNPNLDDGSQNMIGHCWK